MCMSVLIFVWLQFLIHNALAVILFGYLANRWKANVLHVLKLRKVLDLVRIECLNAWKKLAYKGLVVCEFLLDDIASEDKCLQLLALCKRSQLICVDDFVVAEIKKLQVLQLAKFFNY
jgi:hypothetical protein